MALCGSVQCACAIEATDGLAVAGAGSAASPWVLTPSSDSVTSLSYSPGGNVDAETAGVLSLWLSPGNISVPSWAVAAYVFTVISGVFDTGAANNAYNVEQRLGSATGRQIATRGVGTSFRFQLVLNDIITLAATGSLALSVYAQRTAGAGNYRADTSVDVVSVVRFRG